MRTTLALGLVGGLLLAWGCGDDDANAVESVTQLVGPAGGTVALAGGGKVTIPAGALSAEVSIKITKLELDDVAAVPSNLEAAGKPYAFEPHGTVFSANVKIEVPFEGTATAVRPIKLADQQDTSWQTIVGATKDDSSKLISFDASSFSVILAARPRRSSGVITLPDGAIDDGSMPDAVAGSGGTGGASGSGGTGGMVGDSGFDAMVDVDAGIDAAVAGDAGLDASTPANLGYIKASNTGADDAFGNRIAIDGDTLVVGANAEDSNATGVDGDQTNNAASYAGAAYVFVRIGGSWVQQAYLKASNAEANDMFGESVAISGDTIVVGAYSEDSAATGVNGNQADDSATLSGAAYVFVRSGSTWTQQAYLKASNSRVGLNFGLSVAVGGDTIVVGATGDSSNATTIDGDSSNTSAPGAGAAHVFRRVGTTWTPQAYLKASNAEAQDDFGISVAISDDGQDIVVGADREDSNAAGVGGDESNNSAPNAGAAYLFSDLGGWQQRAYFKASNPSAGNVFGYRVAIDGITVAVATPGDDSNATGTDGDSNNTLADNSGAVFVFGNDEGSWRQVAYLKASNTNVGDEFGTSVAIAGDVLVVGAQSERSNATGVDGNQLDNSASGSGAAYVFAGAPGGSFYPYSSWRQQAYLKASNTAQVDNFGTSVAVSSTAIVVGAPGEDSNATGVDGDASNNNASGSGAAYAFDPIVPVFIESCNDGFDDDGDGDPDCSDSECVTSFECVTGCLEPAAYIPLDANGEGIVSNGLVLWLRADVGVALDEATNVCSWEDQSGAGNHVAQNLGMRPLVGAMIAGQPAIDFAGNDGLSRPDVLGIGAQSGRTIFAVGEAQNVTARGKFFFQGDELDNSEWIGLEYNTFNTVGQRFGCYMTGNAYDSNLAVDLLPHVHTLLIDSMVLGPPVLSVMHQRVDGSLLTLTRTPAGTGNGSVTSFAGANVTLVGLLADAKVAELIVYDRPLAPAEITAVESYLATRYGVSLP